jgi:hypothetical protein
MKNKFAIFSVFSLLLLLVGCSKPIDEGRVMKTKIHKLIVVVAFIFASQIGFGQQDIPDNAGGLTVSADAGFFTLGNPRLHIRLELLNTSNHDITVLTKGDTGYYLNMSSDKVKFNFWFWLDSGVKWNGHQIVQSLTKYAPVTIKPNEVTFIFMEVEKNDPHKALQGLTKDSPIVITYIVSPELGTRFGCWSGQIETKPFHIQ